MFRRKNNQDFFPFSDSTVVDLENDLKKLLTTFSDNKSKINELSRLVISKYSEKHRYYHNLSHVKALLSSTKNFKEKFTNYESIQLASWFHDVTYEPKRSDNEFESARLAVEKLSELNLPKLTIKQVETVILATQKHEAEGLDTSGKLFLDLDLGILGTDERTYQNYKLAIRCEYSFVPWFLYRSARAKILTSFLKRETIYFTNELREKLETRARRNIANEIKELS